MSEGVQAYRSLLRAIRVAFNGDVRVQSAARSAARLRFDEGRNAKPTTEQMQDALNHVRSVTKILLENVVQGKNVKEDTYKLNIHKYTERGDNETVKKLDSRVSSFADMKASAG